MATKRDLAVFICWRLRYIIRDFGTAPDVRSSSMLEWIVAPIVKAVEGVPELLQELVLFEASLLPLPLLENRMDHCGNNDGAERGN